jgi:hypothetical protein
MAFVETERWVRFLGRSARNDLTVVSTHRTEKRAQREGIGERHQASSTTSPHFSFHPAKMDLMARCED